VKRVKNAQSRVEKLNARFAGWYYVVSGANFEKLRPSRSALIQKKKG
jgi:hypothetical protein